MKQTPYINHAKRERRIAISHLGVRQYKKMQRQMRDHPVVIDTPAFETACDETAKTLLDIAKPLDLTDEGIILEAIAENPGAPLSLIAKFVLHLSDTQVERRLKKLREAGKIRYDKSAKGWFVVSE